MHTAPIPSTAQSQGASFPSVIAQHGTLTPRRTTLTGEASESRPSHCVGIADECYADYFIRQGDLDRARIWQGVNP